jgi:hypothetical protein
MSSFVDSQILVHILPGILEYRIFSQFLVTVYFQESIIILSQYTASISSQKNVFLVKSFIIKGLFISQLAVISIRAEVSIFQDELHSIILSILLNGIDNFNHNLKPQ